MHSNGRGASVSAFTFYKLILEPLRFHLSWSVSYWKPPTMYKFPVIKLLKILPDTGTFWNIEDALQNAYLYDLDSDIL